MKIENSRFWAGRGKQRWALTLIVLVLAGTLSLLAHAAMPSFIAAGPLLAASIFIEFFLGLAPAAALLACALATAEAFSILRVVSTNGSSSSESFLIVGAVLVSSFVILLMEQLQRARYRVKLVASVARSRYEILLRHDNARLLAFRKKHEADLAVQSASVRSGFELSMHPEAPNNKLNRFASSLNFERSFGDTSPGSALEEWRQRTIHLDGDTHAVLLLHGLASSPLELRHLARFLNAKGFTVHVPVLPGYSDGHPEATMETWVEAATREFDRLAQRYEHVSISGLSMGATLALRVAQDRPSARALALLSVSLDYDGWAIPWYLEWVKLMYFTPFRNSYRYRESEPFGLRNEALRAKIARAVARGALTEIGPPSISVNAIHEACRLMSSARARIGSICSDTLVVHAIDDETSSPRNARFVLDHVNATTTRSVWLDDSYHIVTSDNEREIVAQETALFLRDAEFAHTTGGMQRPVASKALARWNRRQVEAASNTRQAA
jgi:carboxylesterase